MLNKITAADYQATSSERDMQAALFKWAKAQNILMYAVPNGQYRKGQRPEPGLRAGVPDVCVPTPRVFFDSDGPGVVYGALYIELKTAKGRLGRDQRAWITALEQAGNVAVVCRSLDEAITAITEYMTWEPVR